MDSIKPEDLDSFYRGVPPSRKEAEAVQRELQKRVIPKNVFNQIGKIAGADISFIPNEKILICGIIVFSYPELEELERVWTRSPERFPYFPGLLAFREGPAIIETFMKLQNKPDLLMVDGQGIAHPRGLGIASHVGVILDIPSIGVGKSKLFGRYSEPADGSGVWTPLTHPRRGDTIGAVLRTKKGTKPVFVSVGHKVDLSTAVKVTVTCTRGYRIPEPTRRADIFVAQMKKVKDI